MIIVTRLRFLNSYLMGINLAPCDVSVKINLTVLNTSVLRMDRTL